jgi:hypothetical protein
MRFKSPFQFAGAALVLSIALLPHAAFAQAPADKWEFRATGYVYIPRLGGATSFPTPNGSDISVDAGTLISSLKFAVMGVFEARKDRLGVITDIMYFSVGQSKAGTRQLQIPGVPIPPAVTADLELDIKTVVWTLEGAYRAYSNEKMIFDVVGGTRFFHTKGTLDWTFSTDFGPFTGPLRQGTSEASIDNWDGIGGFRSRISLDQARKWFILLYADAGAGQSDFTWQVVAGVGHSLKKADVILAYRYLAYDLKDRRIARLNFNGILAGATFRF